MAALPSKVKIKKIAPILGLCALLGGCFEEVNSNESSSVPEFQYSQVQNMAKCIHEACLDEPIHEENPGEQATLSPIQFDDVIIIQENNYRRRYQSREYRVSQKTIFLSEGYVEIHAAVNGGQWDYFAHCGQNHRAFVPMPFGRGRMVIINDDPNEWGIDQIIVPGAGDWVVISRSGKGVGLESSRAHPQDEVDSLRRQHWRRAEHMVGVMQHVLDMDRYLAMPVCRE